MYIVKYISENLIQINGSGGRIWEFQSKFSSQRTYQGMSPGMEVTVGWVSYPFPGLTETVTVKDIMYFWSIHIYHAVHFALFSISTLLFPNVNVITSIKLG